MELNNDLFVNVDKEKEQGKENFYNEVLEERTKLESELDSDEVTIATTKDQNQEAKQDNQTGSLKKYSHEEVLVKATEYFKGDTLAANVWMNKYALKDSDGNIYEQNNKHVKYKNDLLPYVSLREKFSYPKLESEKETEKLD